MDEIMELHLGDRVVAPTTRQFEQGTVEDISYRFEPHPKDTPFEPFSAPIPTAYVNGAWHDIEALRPVNLPEREDQNLRTALDTKIYAATAEFFNEDEINVKGIDAPKDTAYETTQRLYVKNGYTYEVSVRCVAWPGMED